MGQYDRPEAPVKPKAPCKGCESRNKRCHAECDIYRRFIVANEIFREWRQTQTDIDMTIAENAIANAISHTQSRAKKSASGGIARFK